MMLKRLLKIMAWSTAIVVALALVLVGVVLHSPGLLLNERSMLWGARYLRGHGIVDLRWDRVGLDFERQGFLRRKIHLHFENLCAEKSELASGCFRSLDAEAEAGFARWKPGLLSLGPVIAEQGKFTVIPFPVSAEISAAGKRSETLEEFHLGYEIVASWSERKTARRASAELRGQASLGGLNATLNAEGRGFLPDRRKLTVKDCKIEVARATGTRAKLACPVAAGIPRERWPDLPIPPSASVVLTADLSSPVFPPGPDEKLSGTVAAKLVPIHASFLHLEGGIEARVDGIPSELPAKGKLDVETALTLAVRDFARAVRVLDGTRYAVWAPLRALSGSIELQAKGKLDPKQGKVPITLTTRLSSPRQKLHMDSQGMVVAENPLTEPRIHAQADVLLSDVQLEAPRLELAEPPAVVADSRIRAQEKQKAGAAPSIFDFQVRIRTPGGKPVRVLSNLAQAPVPVALDLNVASDAELSGSVAVQEFPVRFFSRQAQVDHFRVTWAGETRPIDGELRMDLTDYEVRVLAAGTAEKPAFTLQSDPPLSQDQILALLFYGQSPDELDEDQSASVGSAQAAMRDRAIGLASFLLLGSTPVQAVAYDSATRQVQVRFRLGEGTSLNVAAGQGAIQDVGVRKRLGKHWAIATDVNTAPGEDRIVSAFLEWAGRY